MPRRGIWLVLQKKRLGIAGIRSNLQSSMTRSSSFASRVLALSPSNC